MTHSTTSRFVLEQFVAEELGNSSYLVAVRGPLSAWVGWTIPLDDPVVLVASTREDAWAAQRQLARIGMDAIRGWLPVEGWDEVAEPPRTIRRGSVEELAARRSAGP
jgi:hypothetical protein